MAEHSQKVQKEVPFESPIDKTIETLSEQKCDSSEQETIVSSLGPRYTTYNNSIVATGKEGRALGELYCPFGVAIHEDTHQILVANFVTHRIEIFSEVGEFLNQLGARQLSFPQGIATHGDSVYVSCVGDNTVSKYSLTEMCCVRRIGGFGSANEEFIYPSQLTADPIGRIFTADSFNNRICIHDPDLNYIRNITHQPMSRPSDVKLLRDHLYVLCPNINPCMLVFTLEGDKLRSFITCGEGMDVLHPESFCFDSPNNFVISDHKSHSIRVFSPEGNLLHTIGSEGHQPGMFSYPRGVAITPNGRLVCVSRNTNYGLQIFQ